MFDLRLTQQGGGAMPLKYVADALTGVRFVSAIVVFWAGMSQLWDVAMVTFIIGILSDALDGPAARKWPYTPEENQRLVWRRKDPHMWDNAADFALMTGGLVAITFGLLSFWQAVSICAGTALLSVCLVVALEGAAHRQQPKLAEWIDVAHGWVFGLELAVVLMVMTIQATDWWFVWLVIYGVAALLLVRFKWDRVTSRPEVSYVR